MSQRSGKVEKDVSASTANRLLVICIDRDNDVGEKAGIVTPVIGRDACIEAAQRLALEDPEDADSNSIFSAIKTYEDLISKGYKVEVVTVAGVKNKGVHADERISNTPATIVNILIKPIGVGFDQLDHALSISNALIKNAPPKILTRTANISPVISNTVAIPPINKRIPGTPKKNFEYLGS